MASELTTDPRTGLEIVDIPQDHAKYFGDLKKSLIHWFGTVDKYNRMWKPQRRVAIISDQCVYLCRLEGGVTRCLYIKAIQELVLSEQTAIGFRVGPPDYDMLMAVQNMEQREAIVHIVSKVYWALVGHEIKIRRLAGDSGEAMQQKLQLTKPADWSLKIEPMTSTKALTKLMLDKQKKEEADRRVVEEEFSRIKDGLRLELQRYRTVEYDRMVDQLSQYVKTLEEKDREIQRLKDSTVSLDDPEVWRKCPNCVQLKRVLDSHTNDDKQKIMRLEREMESQRHIVEHLQAAIQFRSQTVKHGGENTAESSAVAVLRQDLADANRRNKELQQLILESPYLTADVKQRATRITQQRDGAAGQATPLTNRDWADVVSEKEREIKHVKSLLRDATYRQVQELENIRGQFAKYDAQIVDYLEKVFSGRIQASGQGSAKQMAEATAKAARESATPVAFGSSSPSNAAGSTGMMTSLLMDRNQPTAGGGHPGFGSPNQFSSSSYQQQSSSPHHQQANNPLSSTSTFNVSAIPSASSPGRGGVNNNGARYAQPYDAVSPSTAFYRGPNVPPPGQSAQPGFAPASHDAASPSPLSFGSGGGMGPTYGRNGM